jgi:hypothetical protein
MRAAVSGISVRSRRTFEWQRLIAAWLVLLLAFATFETARHSVHHLDDDDLAACIVACAGTNVPIAEVPPVVVTPVADVVQSLPIDRAPSAVVTRPPDVPEGRGPPLSLSA